MRTVSLATLVTLVLAASTSSMASAAPPVAPPLAHEAPHVAQTPHAGSSASASASASAPASMSAPAAMAAPVLRAPIPRFITMGPDTSGRPFAAPASPPRSMKIDMPPKLAPVGEGYVPAEGIARTPTVVGFQDTGVGNSFSLSTTVGNTYMRPGASATERPVAATVRYNDKASYFKGADSVEAVAVLHVRTMAPGGKDGAPVAVGPEIERTVHVVLTKEDGRYVGTFQTVASGTAGKSEEQIDRMDLAFSANGKWDSNDGRNYKD